MRQGLIHNGGMPTGQFPLISLCEALATTYLEVFRVPPIQAFAVDANSGTLYAAWHDTTDVSGGNYNLDVYLTNNWSMRLRGEWVTGVGRLNDISYAPINLGFQYNW